MTPMLVIRLQRVGKRNEPVYRIVLTDSKNGPKSGRFLKVLGNYDARDKNETKIDEERVNHWILQGAQLSDTVYNLFINKGIIKGEKNNVLPKKSPVVKETEEEVVSEEPTTEAPVEETPTEEPQEEKISDE